MEETETHTGSAEERLKQLNEERKALRVQVKDERTKRLEKAAEMRVGRDEKIEKIQKRLVKIQDAIYKYNKLGKVEKMNVDILEKIHAEISLEDIEAEADGECNNCDGKGCEVCDASMTAN